MIAEMNEQWQIELNHDVHSVPSYKFLVFPTDP